MDREFTKAEWTAIRYFITVLRKKLDNNLESYIQQAKESQEPERSWYAAKAAAYKEIIDSLDALVRMYR